MARISKRAVFRSSVPVLPKVSARSPGKRKRARFGSPALLSLRGGSRLLVEVPAPSASAAFPCRHGHGVGAGALIGAPSLLFPVGVSVCRSVLAVGSCLRSARGLFVCFPVEGSRAAGFAGFPARRLLCCYSPPPRRPSRLAAMQHSARHGHGAGFQRWKIGGGMVGALPASAR